MIAADRLASTAPATWNGDEISAYVMGALVGLRLAADHPTAAGSMMAELEAYVAAAADCPTELVEVLVRGAARDAVTT